MKMTELLEYLKRANQRYKRKRAKELQWYKSKCVPKLMKREARKGGTRLELRLRKDVEFVKEIAEHFSDLGYYTTVLTMIRENEFLLEVDWADLK